MYAGQSRSHKTTMAARQDYEKLFRVHSCYFISLYGNRKEKNEKQKKTHLVTEIAEYRVQPQKENQYFK